MYVQYFGNRDAITREYPNDRLLRVPAADRSRHNLPMTARKRKTPGPPHEPPPVPLRALDGARQPLYMSLARLLKQDIASGRYAVGTSLPPEDSLAERHGLSRHTVRQALRELKEEGVIWARPGIGTKVRAKPETPRFFSGINTISDLLQFVGTTEMHVLSRSEIVADEAFAAQLQCPPGQAWAEIDILRQLPGQPLPLHYLQVYLRPEYADAVGTQTLLTQPVYSLVEARYGVRIVEVMQEITAASLTPAIAQALQAVEHQAAMRITRRYLDRNGSVILVGIGHYPSGRYTQRTRFRAQSAEGEGDD
jgi:DNA-binding GntR family transcriptional regulator